VVLEVDDHGKTPLDKRSFVRYSNI
jgi:hypothetical protein